MTTLESNLLLEVAKRMPELFFVIGLNEVHWRDTAKPVTTLELLSVAAEFEKAMKKNYNPVLSSPQDWDIYRWELISIIAGKPAFNEGELLLSENDILEAIDASFVQRAQAWLKVKGDL